jgi:uncharacterized protein YndB with AHSA1/START domain
MTSPADIPTASPTDITETTVHKSITVNAPIERAFEVFTTRFDTWWPRSHHIGAPDIAEAVLDQRAGGRWYERGVDGSECDWGAVLEFDPPSHVALSWRIDGTFHSDAGPGSRVDVWFTQESPDVTRVDLAHSQLDRHGETWRQLRDGVDSDGGWATLLDTYATAVAS